MTSRDDTTKTGVEITDAVADEMATEFESDAFADEMIANGTPISTGELEQRAGRGRPSLAGGAGRSPKIQVRLAEELHARARARAEADGETVSDVVRDALERHLDS